MTFFHINEENFSIKLNIDDDNYYFDNADYNLYQACLLSGIYLPRFCYHNKLKIAGNCRICLVEDPKSPKPIISCASLINKDQSIYTKTSLIKQSQEGIIEYLLINHPLDCPICDQGGECDLQDQTMIYGSDKGRYYESYKRSVENVNYGPFIKFILNRCIHCARCTRFLSDLAGMDFLTFINRGQKTQISAYIDGYLSTEVSGNIIDICPVGALTSKPYSFNARVWEMSYIKYVDVFDSFNSNIRIDLRGLDVIRVLPYINEFLNEEWISDTIRFFYDSILLQRLLFPLFFFNKKKIYLGWLKTLKLLKFFFFKQLTFFNFKKVKYSLNNLFIDNFIDSQSVFYLKKFFFNFNFNFFNIFFKKLDFRKNYLNCIDLNELQLFKSFAIVNINTRYESPIFNIKLKSVSDEHDVTFYNLGFLSNSNYNIQHLGSVYFALLNFFEDTTDILFICPPGFFNIHNNFVNVAHLSKSHVDLSVYETGLMTHFKKNNIFSMYKQNCLSYIINNDCLTNILLKSNYMLNVYQGQHGDNYSKLANIILPNKLFFEKSAYYLNTFGLLQNLTNFYFDYGFKKTKTDIEIFSIIAFIFKTKKEFIIDNFIFVKESYVTLICSVYKHSNHIFNLFNKPNKSVINNFYTNNSITRASKILTSASKLYTVFNDFIFVNYNNLY